MELKTDVQREYLDDRNRPDLKSYRPELKVGRPVLKVGRPELKSVVRWWGDTIWKHPLPALLPIGA